MKKPLHVLIVEDSEENAKPLLDAMRRRGYAPVWERVDAPERMADALDRGPWDVVLSGFALSRFGALDALSLLKQREQVIPLIVVSENIGEERVVSLLKAGAHDYVSRGNLARLAPAVEKGLREAEGYREWKRLQEELERREEGYRLLFESNPNPMWVRDLETLAFLAVNDAAIRHYGYRREEFLSMTIKDIRPPEEVPQLIEGLSKQIREFDRAGIWTHRKKDGSLIQVEITYHNLTFAGRPARLILAHDVTERRRAEEALSESYDLLHAVFEGTTDVVYAKDVQGRYVMINSAFARLLEKTVEEVIGKTDADFFQEETARRIMEADRRILSSGETETYEQNVSTGGSTRVFLTTKGIRRDHLGKAAGVIGISRDITERKRAEETLQETEARLRLMITQVPAILWTTDPGLRFTSSMGAGLANLGLMPNQVVGTSLYEFFQTQDPKFLSITMHQRALNGESVTYEMEWGGRVYQVYVEPFLNAEGRIIGSIGIALDITERKQAEEALGESEQEIRAILNAIPDLMFQISKEGVYLEFKPAKGLEPYRLPGEFIGKRIADIMPPELTRQSMHYVLRALQTDETQVYDYRLEQNGKLRDFEARIIPRGKDKVLAIVRDISDRKRMEEALKLQARVLESMAEGVNVADESGIIAYTNPTFDAMFGYERGELIGRHVTVLNSYSPEENVRIVDDIIHQLRNEGVWRGEFSNVRKDGVPFTTSTHITSLDISNKRYWVSVQEDITERKKTEGALRQSNQMLEGLIQASPLPIVVFDSTGTVKLWNPAAQQIFGWSAEEVLGRFLPAIPDDKREEFQEIIDFVMQGRAVIGKETRRQRKGGIPIQVSLWVVPFSDADGNRQCLAIVADVTEVRKLEEELLRARKLESVGLLAGGIAHDFNNILTAILGNISLAKTSLDPQNPLSKRLNEAERATLRAKDLSRQLLTFAKGGAPLKKITSIAELLEDSAGFALQGSNVRSEFSLPGDLWPVEIDEGQINQVIHNLVINAQQAMPQGGVVRVGAKNVTLGKQSGFPVEGGSYVEISIKDSGIGIPGEILDKIFDPYFTTKQKGSGLGLSTSYSIVKKHGGHIAVDSKPGVGSTFFVYLPASPGAVLPQGGVEEKPRRGSGRILLMDDEESVLEAAGEMLRHLGYDVDLAKDGREAVSLYQAAKAALRAYDAVIIDLTIPGGMGGEETIVKLREIDPGVRAVVSSGYSNDPIMADFQRYGFCDFIAKPYRIEELGRVLHKVLRERRD